MHEIALKAVLSKLSRLFEASETQSRSLGMHPCTENGRSINDLPNEILVCVFEYVRQGRTDRDACRHEDWTQPFQICRRWRSVIISTSTLWSDVYLTTNSRWLDLCLSRCADAHINLHCIDSRPPSIDCITSVLPRYARNITGLYIEPHRGWAAPLEHILQVPMPALLSLQIEAFYVGPARVKLEGFIHLQHLRLYDGALQLEDAARLSSLRTLTLRQCHLPFSFREFVDILAAATGLEVLRLDGSLRTLRDCPGGFAKDPSLLRPMITLERLGELRIGRADCALLSHIMPLLDLPHAVLISISSIRSDSGPLHDLSYILPASMPALVSATTSLTFKIRNGVCTVSINADDPTSASSESTLLHAYMPDRGRAGAHAFGHLLDVFASAPISELALEGESLDYYDTDLWAHAFRSCPRLQHLHVSGSYGSPDDVFAGLERASDTRFPSCCPSLATMKIGTSDSPLAASDTTYGSVLRALRKRAAHGAGLESLELYLLGLACVRGTSEEVAAILAPWDRSGESTHGGEL